MKKILCLILSLAMLAGLAACRNSGGSGSAKAEGTYTVYADDGSIYEATPEEILDAAENNALKYESMYEYATISGKGTITQILESSEKRDYYVAVLDDGVNINIYLYNLKDSGVDVGDVVKFSGELWVEDSAVCVEIEHCEVPTFYKEDLDKKRTALPHNDKLKFTGSLKDFQKAEKLVEDHEETESVKEEYPDVPAERLAKTFLSENDDAQIAGVGVRSIKYRFYEDRLLECAYAWDEEAMEALSEEEGQAFMDYLDSIYGEHTVEREYSPGTSNHSGTTVTVIRAKDIWSFMVDGERYSMQASPSEDGYVFSILNETLNEAYQNNLENAN